MTYQKIGIVSGGSVNADFARQWIETVDYVIVADSGMECMRSIGKNPDMIIGDFDSVGAETLAYFKGQDGITWKQLIPEKDDTDTEFAIRQAIALGAKKILLLGATGTRLDHVLANVSLLGIGLQEHVTIIMMDEHNRIRMLDKGLTIKKSEQYGSFVSLIPYSGAVKHIYLEGFKYPLQDFTMEQFNSIGISNEIIDEKAEIRFEEGVLLMIEARD